MGNNNTTENNVKENDKPQMVVERLEDVLLEEEDDLEVLDYSMEESEDFEDDIEMSEEVEDSSTLGKFQKGIRKESEACYN